MRGQLRPARKPLERCLTVITAVLLNGLDRLLLQDDLRLSGSTYTVGGGRLPWAVVNVGRPHGAAPTELQESFQAGR